MDGYWGSQSREGYGVVQELLGIPNSVFKTKGEILLSQQRDIRNSLVRLEGYAAGNQSATNPDYRPPVVEVNFDADSITSEFSSGFDRLVSEQANLQESVGKLGIVGLAALSEHRLSNDMLNRLNQHQASAFEQRNAALSVLSSEIASASHYVVESIDSLSGDVVDMKTSLLHAILEIGPSIGQMVHDEAANRFRIVEAIKRLQEVYLWSQKDNAVTLRNSLDYQKKMADMLANPRTYASEEEWRLGESCRLARDYGNAKKMFEASLSSNPTNAKAMFSLGLLSIEAGLPSEAVEWFDRSAKFSNASWMREFSGFSKLHSAKVLRVEGDFEGSLQKIDQALGADVGNFESWFEAANISASMGKWDSSKEALYVIIRYSPTYRLKVLWDPLFYPIGGFIHDLIESYP